MSQLCDACWHLAPDLRPDFDTLSTRLSIHRDDFQRPIDSFEALPIDTDLEETGIRSIHDLRKPVSKRTLKSKVFCVYFSFPVHQFLSHSPAKLFFFQVSSLPYIFAWHILSSAFFLFSFAFIFLKIVIGALFIAVITCVSFLDNCDQAPR